MQSTYRDDLTFIVISKDSDKPIRPEVRQHSPGDAYRPLQLRYMILACVVSIASVEISWTSSFDLSSNSIRDHKSNKNKFDRIDSTGKYRHEKWEKNIASFINLICTRVWCIECVIEQNTITHNIGI